MTLEHTTRDVLYALRSFRRAPLAALTIVATVALGLALVAVVFTFFNAFCFRTDAVRNPDELFRVLRVPHAGANVWMEFTRADYDALRRETAVFADVAAVVRGVPTRIDARPVNGTLVSGNFFQMLGADPLSGRTLTPADDQSGAPAAIVLSHLGWRRLFGGDRGVVGRRLVLNGVTCEVAGVMADGFRGLALGAPDYWAPLALAGRLRESYAGREQTIPVAVIGRLKGDTPPQTAIAALSVWASARDASMGVEKRAAYFRLRPSRGTVGDDADEVLMVFAPLFFAFGLILLIGCANVANLLLARGISRQREIGVRLSLGASRRRVIRQLLTESLLLAFAAAAGAFALSRVLLEMGMRVLAASMPPEMAEQMNLAIPPSDWRVLLFLAGGAIASTIFFGLMPALQATRLELVRTMRGEVARDARPGRARNLLIGVQVTASALLLICSAVFLRSSLAIGAANPGVRTSDTLLVDVETEAARDGIVQALASHPLVASTAASYPHALSTGTTFAAAADTAIRAGVGYRLVSAEYFDVLGVQVTRGRGFGGAERTPEAGVAVISDSAAKLLWPDSDPLGRVVRLDAVRQPGLAGGQPPPARTATVVGVVRDVGRPLRTGGGTLAVVYLPTSVETVETVLTVRVRGDVDHARRVLTERLMQVDPALGAIMTLRTLTALEGWVLAVAFRITIALGGLALALTLSGLFSVLSYEVEQRRHEIGVRLAVGASTRDITRLMLWQSVPPVLGGLFAGAGLAATVASVLTSMNAEAAANGTVRVLDPLAYAAGTISILVACLVAASIPSLRASRIDPIATLRQQ